MKIENIRVKELIQFNRKGINKSREKFAKKLKSREKKVEVKTDVDSSGGGDYWISSDSCILNVFKNPITKLFDEKIIFLEDKLRTSELERTKVRIERNIQILNNFKDFDLTDIRPSVSVKNIPIKKSLKEFSFEGIPLFVNPSYIYCYKNNNEQNCIGVVWFVSQIGGYTKSELGVFCELLFNLLKKEFGIDYLIDYQYCCVVDTFNATSISYRDMVEKKIPVLLQSIIEEIKLA